jgi:hypothetical protein
MIIDLEKTLGRALTVKQVAEFLNINEKTVRENYQQFGIIKIGRHKLDRLWQTFKSTKRTFSRVQHSI